LRGETVALERRIEDVAATLAGLTVERERKEAAITAADASRLATDVLHRIETRLASLQPPQHPTTKGTDQ
jgi:coenzyme F420-reducing hydrogenase delta subunit